MTLHRTVVAAGTRALPSHAPWRTDMIETVKLAWPIALTQLGQIAMMTTDLALIGRLGEHAIAAVGLAVQSVREIFTPHHGPAPFTLIVLVVVLLLFGRGKIPELMGDVAKGIKSFKKGMSDDEAAATDKTLDSKTVDHKSDDVR